MDANEIALFLAETLGGEYRIDRHLGAGHFCGAFVAENVTTKEEVAAKVLKLGRSQNPDDRREFRDEISLLEKLADRSHVVGLVDSGTHRVRVKTLQNLEFDLETDFCILELAAGSLAQLILAGTSFGWPDRLRLFRDVVKGIHQMHLSGVVHRDLKADNVLVFDQPQVAKVADLGRAHDIAQPPRFAADVYLTARGDLRFAPLEFLWLQGTTEPLDQARADLYLLGSLLYELAPGVGLTSLLVGDPLQVIRGVEHLDAAQRKGLWKSKQAGLRAQQAVTLESFDFGVPAVIRRRLVRLIAELVDPDPQARVPAVYGGRSAPSAWDLQWLLGRVDGLRRAVDPVFRQQSRQTRRRQTGARSR